MVATELGTQEFADFHGVVRRTVHRWRAAGCPCEKVDGRLVFDPEEATPWLEDVGFLEPDTIEQDAADNYSRRARLDEAKIIERETIAELKRLKLEEARGNLVPMDEHRDALLSLANLFRSRISSIPSRYSAKWAGIKNARTLRKDMTSVLNKLLQDISDQVRRKES